MLSLPRIAALVTTIAAATLTLTACSGEAPATGATLQVVREKAESGPSSAPAEPTFTPLAQPATTTPAPAAPTTTTKAAAKPRPTTSAAAPTTRKAAPQAVRPPTTTTSREAAPVAAPPADQGQAGEVLALVNAERGNAGCSAVELDGKLNAAATAHSKDMADNNYFDHESQDGRSFVDRAEAAGYTDASSENIAAGQQTPADVMDGWMNSDGHRANILNCDATQMGIGSAEGGDFGIYWTQMFGTG